MRILIVLFFLRLHATAQEIKVEFDKKQDFSKYKTFSFGESRVVTSSEQKQVSDATIDKWIRNGITRELEYKGMKRVDSSADLVATYALIKEPRLDIQKIGPAGMTPGSDNRTWSRDYTETTLIIDLNNRSNFLVWRVSATADVMSKDSERLMDIIISKGFKKYGKGKRKK